MVKVAILDKQVTKEHQRNAEELNSRPLLAVKRQSQPPSRPLYLSDAGNGELWGDERYESGPLMLLSSGLEHRQYLIATFKDLPGCGHTPCISTGHVMC